MEFETLKQDYNWEWITKDELKEWVNYGVITQEQYNSIIEPIAHKSITNDNVIIQKPVVPIQVIPSTI